MADGDFTGKSLSNYISAGKCDYVEARRIVNGTDRAHKIAGYAAEFEVALRAGYERMEVPEPPSQDIIEIEVGKFVAGRKAVGGEPILERDGVVGAG